MGRWMAVGARLATAALLASGLLAGPGSTASIVLGKAADCPSPPVTIAKLVHLDVPGQRCYGGRILVFRAFVAPPCEGCGGASATVIAPRWLDGLQGSSVNLAAVPEGPQVAAYVPPALGRCRLANDAACPFHPYREQWATVTAQFDAPVAQTCHYSAKPAGEGITKADAVAECQGRLVVLSVGPDSAQPATDTVAVPVSNGRGQPPTPFWFVVYGFALLALVWLRRPALGRR